MLNRKLLLLLLFFTPFLHAKSEPTIPSEHLPFYIGGMGGYGSTTWDGLVPSDENLNLAMSMSTPIQTTEGGGVWGVYAGHEFFRNFAIEVSYMRYPDANIIFDEMSLFSFDNNGVTQFVTHTETVNLMAKILLPLPHTHVRAYSSFGVANVHREDMLLEGWRYSPTFGAGLNYQLSDNLMSELVGNYTAGFGESQLNPTNSYFPFLYSVSLRLAYCFQL